MHDNLLAETTATISELKHDPMATVATGMGFPVAILDQDKPVFYCVPVKAFEALLTDLEDAGLNAIANGRSGETVIRVALDTL